MLKKKKLHATSMPVSSPRGAPFCTSPWIIEHVLTLHYHQTLTISPATFPSPSSRVLGLSFNLWERQVPHAASGARMATGHGAETKRVLKTHASHACIHLPSVDYSRTQRYLFTETACSPGFPVGSWFTGLSLQLPFQLESHASVPLLNL